MLQNPKKYLKTGKRNTHVKASHSRTKSTSTKKILYPMQDEIFSMMESDKFLSDRRNMPVSILLSS
jgi:hypothetical protein